MILVPQVQGPGKYQQWLQHMPRSGILSRRDVFVAGDSDCPERGSVCALFFCWAIHAREEVAWSSNSLGPMELPAFGLPLPSNRAKIHETACRDAFHANERGTER